MSRTVEVVQASQPILHNIIVRLDRRRNPVQAEIAEICDSQSVEWQQYLCLSVNIQGNSLEVALNKTTKSFNDSKSRSKSNSTDSFYAVLILALLIMQTSLINLLHPAFQGVRRAREAREQAMGKRLMKTSINFNVSLLIYRILKFYSTQLDVCLTVAEYGEGISIPKANSVNQSLHTSAGYAFLYTHIWHCK